MTTLSKYEPSLTYESSFDKSASPLQNKKLWFTVGKDKDKDLKSRHVRICAGTTIEEILYTYRIFKNFMRDIKTTLKQGQKLESGDELAAFLSVLGPESRASYNEMIRGVNSKAGKTGDDLDADPYGGDFKEAFNSFILHAVEDPQAKESIIAAFGDGKTFLKPADISVRAQQ